MKGPGGRDLKRFSILLSCVDCQQNTFPSVCRDSNDCAAKIIEPISWLDEMLMAGDTGDWWLNVKRGGDPSKYLALSDVNKLV